MSKVWGKIPYIILLKYILLQNKSSMKTSSVLTSFFLYLWVVGEQNYFKSELFLSSLSFQKSLCIFCILAFEIILAHLNLHVCLQEPDIFIFLVFFPLIDIYFPPDCLSRVQIFCFQVLEFFLLFCSDSFSLTSC